jgi:hypothetical protein
MKHRTILFPVIALCCAASLSALPSHTWVSGSGSDTNTGTFLSPYADFATAVANTAPGGIVTAKDAGDFGAVTLTQSITIDGNNVGSIGFTGGEGIYIGAAPGATINIRNLVINGFGVGTDALFIATTGPSGSSIVSVTVDNCRFENFTQIGLGLGSESLTNVVVKNTTIVGGTLGVRTFQSSGYINYDSVLLDHVTISGATTAAVFSRNGVMQITNSVLTQSVVGVQADTSAIISVANTAITSNQTGVCSYATSKIRLDTNDIYDNTVAAIADCGGQLKTSKTNRTSGTIAASAAEISDSVLF